MVYAVITGDIVDSRNIDTATWSGALHEAISYYTEDFDIFRGDSFQAIVPVEKSLEAAFYIIARIQSVDGIQVRMGIGVGEIDYRARSAKESTGEAFVHSGRAFDSLKKELLAIETPWVDIDHTLNIMLGLCTEISNKWTVNMSESVAKAIENPGANQKELAHMLRRKHQSQVSTELNKAAFFKIQKVITFGTTLIRNQC